MNLDEIKRRINPVYENQSGTESHERKWLCDQIDKLTAERDAALAALELSDAIVAADAELINELKSALREARGMLDLATWRETHGLTEEPELYVETIATINEVLGETE